MKTNPVCWFEIYVQDMPRAIAFYEAMLATKLERLPNPDNTAENELEMWAFPSSQEGNGASGTLCKMTGCPSGGNSTLVYFACDDCAVEAARAAANGGSVVQAKTSIGQYGFLAIVTDSEGNTIGLYSMK